MLSKIDIQNEDDFEFDLSGINLDGLYLIKNLNDIFITNNEYKFLFDNEFLKNDEKISLSEEYDSIPMLIITPAQKKEIINILKNYTNLLNKGCI